MALIILAAYAAPAPAASPFDFDDADLKAAWEESAASFVTPTFDDYVGARAEAFWDEIPELFDGGALPAASAEDLSALGNKGDDNDSRFFTEIDAGGGSAGRLDVAAFQGWEIKFLDAAVSFRERRDRSGDGWYNNSSTRADAEVAFSDQAGTTVGFAGNYEGSGEKLRRDDSELVGEAGDNSARSGEVSAGFRSNLWGKAKIATKVSATFSEGDFSDTRAVDQVITADSSYDFFWVGDNLARGLFSLSQENYEIDGEEQGFLFGRLTLENDIPIANRLYLSGGFGGYLLRDDTPHFRFYPRGRLLLRLTPTWGYFVNYRPGLQLPDFRELYMRTDYTVPTAFRPAEDEYFSVRTGVNYHFRDFGHITGAVYEQRFRRSYAVADAYFAGAQYFDPGKVILRGADMFYRLTVSRFEHYGGFDYKDADLRDNPAHHFPYMATYGGEAGFTVNIGGGHRASAGVRYVGERYARPTASEPLAPAWVPGANVVIRMHPGISVTAAAENLTDEIYYVPGGIVAPGRAFTLGLNLIL
ncbi:MAG: TonB-dependent receptor [Candidatus Zixiibacteriota bacterium]